MDNLDYWKQIYPLSGDPFRCMQVFDSTTIRGLSYVMQCREYIDIDVSKGKPTCLLLPSLRRPDNPRQSKFGGVPFRDSRLPWPKGESGDYLMFFAQFNFREPGLGIMPEDLPGDILLIFTEGRVLALGDPPFFRFEWTKGFPEKFVTTECPPIDYRYVNYSLDYYPLFDFEPSGPALDKVQAILRRIWPSDPGGHWAFDNLHLLYAAKKVLCLSGVKLGGLPFWYNKGAAIPCWFRDGEEKWKMQMAAKWSSSGRFLLSFCCLIHPEEWVNEHQYMSEKNPNVIPIYFWDGFHVNMYLLGNGDIEWTLELI